MESWFQYRARMEKQERRRRLFNALKEFAVAVAFLATIFGLCLVLSICASS